MIGRRYGSKETCRTGWWQCGTCQIYRTVRKLIVGDDVVRLAKHSQWKPIIEFLRDTDINSVRKIGKVRQILASFDDCDDEVSLKKRYLQVRVQKAAAIKANLSEEEVLGHLKDKRTELVNRMRENDERIEILRKQLAHRQKQAIALQALRKTDKAVKEILQQADPNLERAIGADHPMIFKSLENEETMTAALINVRDVLSMDLLTNNDSPTTDSSLSSVGTRLILRAVIACLRETIQSLQQQQIIKDVNRQSQPSIGHLNNIQRTALELAKILILLKSEDGREEALSRLNALCIGTLLKEEKTELDLNEIAKVNANFEEASRLFDSNASAAINSTEKMISICQELVKTASNIAPITDDTCAKINTEPSYPRPELIDDSLNGLGLIDVVAHSALMQNEPTDLGYLQEQIKQNEIDLNYSMEQASGRILDCRNLSIVQAKAFAEEIEALELLERTEYKSLVKAIYE